MVDQPGKESTMYAVITLLRMVSKPVKITKLLKYHQKTISYVAPSWFLIFPLGVYRDCSPDDLHTVELLKTANLQYKFNLNPNKSVHQIFVSVSGFCFYKFPM